MSGWEQLLDVKPERYGKRRKKLTPERVAMIRKEHSEGKGYRQLGRLYGVAWQTIADIVKGRTWQT